MSEKLHILTRASSQENYIDLCHCKSFTTCIISDDLLLKMKATQSIEMSGSTHPMTQRHIREELNPQPYCCKESLILQHTVRQYLLVTFPITRFVTVSRAWTSTVMSEHKIIRCNLLRLPWIIAARLFNS